MYAFRWFSGLSLGGRILVLIGGLFALACVFFAEENWRGRHAWEASRGQMEAKGVVLDWQKFIPPTVPDDQNFAMTPFLAPLFDFNPKPRPPGQAMWRDMEGHDRAINFAASLLAKDNQGQLPHEQFDGKVIDLEAAVSLVQSNRSPATVPMFSTRAEAASALLAALEEYRPVLEELRDASRKPYSRFNIEYDAEDPFSILLPHYIVLHRVSRVLEMRASAELALGKTDVAFEDVKLTYWLAQATKDEPFMIGVQSRGSIMKRAEQVIWEGLAGRAWTEAQLQQLQALVAGFTVLKDLERGLSAERAGFGEAAFRYMRSNKNSLRNWMAADEAAASLWPLLAGPSGWLSQEQVAYHRLYDLRVMTGFDADAGRVYPQKIEESKRALERELEGSSLWHHTGFSKLILPFLMKAFQPAAAGQNRVNQTITACALERYRVANGKYPEKLDLLVPRFVEKAPMDVCDGQPLKYQVLQDGHFLLYSVGWNEKDDAGLLVVNKDGSAIDPNQGDWPWPAYAQK